MRTLIIDNYDSFTFNLFQYVAEMGGNPVVKRNDEISAEEIRRGEYTHIIISPGPGTPEHARDFGVCGEVIRKFSGLIPILGVCLGHQGIIHMLGGKITRAPTPVHGKKSFIRIHNSHALFSGLPEIIEGMRYHSLIGESKNLPAELEVIAETVDNQILMGIAHRKHPLFGLQFHPESIGTPYGKTILKNFLSIDMCDYMASGKMDEEESEKILREIASRGETVAEIVSMAKTMRKIAVPLPLYDTEVLMDTCGTGGSGLARMNISTTAAFVLAAAGIKIAKHGNRAASGRSGSFDLLETLGININCSPKKTAAMIHELGIGFLFAPMFHPAMKRIAPVRKKIGGRTIFNLLGPLTNPANPQYQLLGTSSPALAKKLIEALRQLGSIRAITVCGEDGLDDVTLCGKTHVFELMEGKIKYRLFSPEEVGIPIESSFKNISGGTPEHNAQIFLLLLQNRASGPLQNLLSLNCAFGLYLMGAAQNIPEGLAQARTILQSGAAYEKFLAYRTLSNS